MTALRTQGNRKSYARPQAMKTESHMIKPSVMMQKGLQQTKKEKTWKK